MESARPLTDRLLVPNPSRSRAVRIAFAFLIFILGYYLCAGSDAISRGLKRASYEWLYKLNLLSDPDISRDGVVIVYVDELSQKMLEQPRNQPWDRRLYARIIDRLQEEGAKAIVLDVIFSGPSTEEADRELERAIRESGRVVLGVDMASGSQTASQSTKAQFETLVFPEERFVNASARLGLVHLKADEDFIIREHFHATPYDGLTSLSWAAAEQAQLPITKNPNLTAERWVRYYGGPETIPHVSFCQALLEPNFPRPGFFKDKVVFIGARPTATLLVERRDEFRSSYNSWNERFLFMPAVEVHATTFLNLKRQDWLRRTPPFIEVVTTGVLSLLVFAAIKRLRPTVGAFTAFCAILLIGFGAIILFRLGWWTPWLVFLFVYVPAGALGCFLFSSLDWLIQRRSFREQERAANQRIQQQAALLDKTQDAIIVRDLELRATFWNNGAERTYGWTVEEVCGKNLDELLSRGSSAMIIAQAETMKSGEWAGELKHFTKAGKEILVQSRWSLLRGEDRAPKGVLIISSDVTEQRQLETQLLRSQRLDSLGTLAGGIAHDLNNVLSPILMGVELVRLKARDPGLANLLNTIETSAQRGAALVKQVLTFARGVDGEQRIVQVRHLLKEMDKILAETFPKNINVSIQVCPKLHTIKADITQLHQVILNLCVNARDAMPDGGQLKIDARNAESLPAHLRGATPDKTGEHIVVKVADTGTGIPPEIADKIFEPFFTTKEVGKGTGLGLATVASIVKKHQGVLDFKSVVGQGTEFILYLPAARDEAAAEQKNVVRSSLTGNEELILVVDDEQAIRSTLEEMLTSANFQVLTASHAQAALELVADSGSSLAAVVIDRMMPGLDSLQAMKRMKMLHPSLPIICMSGLTPNDHDLLETADAFLQKPFTREKVLLTVRDEFAKTQTA